MSLRVIFMGSPELSVPTLKALYRNFDVIGVVTQRDKPRGRGRKTNPTAVKAAALELAIPVIEPDSLSEPETLVILKDWKPDAIVVAAYGKILPDVILKLPPLGCVNLHASLLPRHRGASPISAAILAGDRVTGVCTIIMDHGMDTGDILLKKEIPIREDDTAGTLHDRLLEPGAELVVETLRGISENRIRPVPQDHSKATYSHPMSKQDGKLDWRQDAEYLSRLVRAMNPWPGAFFHLSGEAIKIWSAAWKEGNGEPACIFEVRSDGILVGTGKGLLLLLEVQAPGKRRVAASELARSRHLKRGDILDQEWNQYPRNIKGDTI